MTSEVAEIRVPVTDLVQVFPEGDVREALQQEKRAKVTQVYYNLYGQLIISGEHLVLPHAAPWFRMPLAEGIHGWLRHGHVAADDGERMVITD